MERQEDGELKPDRAVPSHFDGAGVIKSRVMLEPIPSQNPPNIGNVI